MQALLTGKRRLPGFVGEWAEVPLGDLGRCYRGVSYNPNTDLSPIDTSSTVRLLRSNNVQDSVIVLQDLQYVSADRVSEAQRLHHNDVVICMANGSRGLVGKAAKFRADDGYEYTFGAFMGCYRPNTERVDPDLAYYQFQTQRYRNHISILLAGSSINNLTPDNLESFVTQMPTERDEQSAIAAVLCDMDAAIDALEAKLAKARLVKQGMMQELLTGRVRLVFVRWRLGRPSPSSARAADEWGNQ